MTPGKKSSSRPDIVEEIDWLDWTMHRQVGTMRATRLMTFDPDRKTIMGDKGGKKDKDKSKKQKAKKQEQAAKVKQDKNRSK